MCPRGSGARMARRPAGQKMGVEQQPWAPGETIDPHGIVGDLRTTALIAADGTVDSWCLPDADSASVFAAVLDSERGGHLRCDVITNGAAESDQQTRHRQHYLPGTNILITRLHGNAAIVEIVDFMLPTHLAGGREGVLVRRITALHGPRRVRLRCWPGFDYARAEHQATTSAGDHVVRFDAGGSGSLTLRGSVVWRLTDRERGPEAVADVELGAGETAALVLQWGDRTAASEAEPKT